MRLKQRLEDFRVRELLAPDYIASTGPYRVYRVTKKKQTSLEAAARIAHELGVGAGEVSLAGLKDRQGVTTQYMAVRSGRDLSLADNDLRVESAGFAARELDSEHSTGNAFEVIVRALDRSELDVLRANIPIVRTQGFVNYFDEQRFGNLRHGQGWIALDLMRGEHERALLQLLAAPSVHDDARTKAFKAALNRVWGDWSEAREIAGRFGAHHSIFEHLKRNQGDFAGAFFHVSSRVRLIHLYAFQSHLWNRAVAACIRRYTTSQERAVVSSAEGPLVYPAGPFGRVEEIGERFRLPGPRLADVAHPMQRQALEQALERERLAPADFQIEGVSGFQLKGEDRPLFVFPAHLRVRPAEPDPHNRGAMLVKLRFDLPRGAYATLVVRRLFARAGEHERPESAPHAGPRGPARERGPKPQRDEHRGDNRRRTHTRRPERGGERPRRLR